MPHVIDRLTLEQKDLGPCECPNTPHPVDWVRLTSRYSYMDKMGLADAASQGVEAMARYRFRKRVADWNLVDEKGRKLPITYNLISELSEETATKIWNAIDELDAADEDTVDLPNPSSAP